MQTSTIYGARRFSGPISNAVSFKMVLRCAKRRARQNFKFKRLVEVGGTALESHL